MKTNLRWHGLCVAWLWGASAWAGSSFPVLQVDPQALSRHTVVDEAKFAGQGWADIERVNATLSSREVGHFEGVPTGWFARPVRIHHRSYVLPAEQEKGAAVVVPGFTEGLVIYQEVIHDLLNNGWSVYILDHRNQGFSTRLIDAQDGWDKGHVDEFEHLVSDLRRFVALVQASRAAAARDRSPMVLLAHSMGAAVSALMLARDGDQTPFSAAAFVTPMMAPTVAPANAVTWGDRSLRRWCDEGRMPWAFGWPGLSTVRASGGTFEQEWRRYREMLDCAAHAQTHSVVRHDVRWANRASLCEGDHCGHTDAKVAGATLGWVAQACAASAEARGEGARRIQVPVLLLQGGEDTVVEPRAQEAFCEQVNVGKPPEARGRCTGLLIPEARHGLLVEVDRLRRPALVEILSSWERVLARPRP